MVLCLIFWILVTANIPYQAWTGGLDMQGPQFDQEPPHRLEFSNSSGGRADCSAHGSPQPETEWIGADGQPIQPIPEIRHVFANGTIVFPPFTADRYRHDVHATIYRCRVKSIVGILLSREMHVRAVVKQSYEVQVYDEYVISGNTAVLRCQVPSYVSEYVLVTSWLQDKEVNIYPNTDVAGKYAVLANGDLYISNAGQNDGYKSYVCRTLHRLTGEVQSSTYPGRVIVTEPKGPVQPRVTVEKHAVRRAALGEDVTLPCVAQGHPVPQYTWLKDQQIQQPPSVAGSQQQQMPPVAAHAQPVPLGDRFTLLAAGLLRIAKVRLEDAGKYTCVANNSAGEESVRVTLEVTSSLSAHMQPQSQTIDVGKQAEFHCIVGGHPITKVTWLHDGKPLVRDGRVDVSSDPYRLQIRNLQKEDRGMYQCVVGNDLEQATAGGELDMGDAGPELAYWFGEQTLQPEPTVSLKCVATGNPPPQFTWTLDGFPVPDNSRFLVGQYVTIHDDVISHVNITNVKPEDGGEYSCTAHNSVGRVTHSAKVNVFGLPYIREMPKVTGVAGKDFIIKCPVAGYPIETITWELEGAALPVNVRQKVYPNGTLIIKQAQKEDAKTYTCQAANKQRNIARRDVELQIIVPPKILPMQAMTNVLREGMRAALSCQILEGDLPITFTWLKNGQPLAVGNGTTTRQLDEYSASLIIEQVSSAHTANYTCVANNVAGRESFTVPLTVNVPPRWTVEPIDSNVAAGQDITLHCQADGYPTPTINWRKAIGEQPGEYKDFLFEPNVHPYLNGSITFVHIAKESEGQYLCEGKNTIGSGVSKVIFLKVNAPAHFPQKSKQVQVVKGEQAHLQCTAIGDTPIEIMWKMGGQHIAESNDQKYTIREQLLADSMVSELGISGTTRLDTGIFTCFASNAYGRDSMNIQLIVQEIPEPPRNIRVTDQQSRSIGLSWTQSYAGNSQINNYIIQYKLGSDEWPSQPSKISVPGSQITATVQNLRPAQVYYIRILAENRLGLSEPSEIVQVSTLEEVPSGSPNDIRAEAKSSTEIVVTWEPPPRETWNGNLLGYHVGYLELTPVNRSQSYTFKSVEVRAHYGGEAILQGLSKYTTYNVIVQAYNSRGSGPASSPVSARTLEDAPTMPPENVQCSVMSPQSLHVNWEPPPAEGRNGIIKGYKVTHHSVSEYLDKDDQQTKVTQLQRTTISGLRKYTNYSITVLAYTARGDGVRSDPIYCQTEEDVPSAPADIKAMLSAPNKILISWLPPKYSNGLLEAYTFYMSTLEEGAEAGTHKRVLSPNTEHFETVRLKETSTYQFWVTASTRVGEGEATKTVTISSSNSVPAKIASFGREIITAWKKEIHLPCKRVGQPLPKPIWKQNDQPLELGTRKLLNSDATLVIKDVQNVDQANYTCTVENSNGKDEITYSLKVLVPPEPPILSVVESFADSLHLKWKDKNNGGSPILGYGINYKRDHGDWEELQIAARTDSHMLRNLWCGTRYQLYITAFNRIGNGLPCDIVNEYTKGTVPVKPKQSQMLTMNATVATVWLDSWGDGGCGILYFSIEYRAEKYEPWIMVSSHIKPTERIFSVGELFPSTEYQLRVTAVNNAGSTMAVYNFTTLTPLGAVPKLSPPVSHSGDQPFYANARVFLPILGSILLLSGLIAAFLLIRRRKLREENENRPMGESPSMAQIQNKQNRDQQYLAVRVNRAGQLPMPVDTNTYKTNDSAGDYIEDICPYATFQLAKPSSGVGSGLAGNCGNLAYSESSYSGNVYSGPYHSVRGSFLYHDVKPPPVDKFRLPHNKEPEYTKVRRKGGRLRDPHSESQEYDTMGSDSEGDAATHASQELISFRHRMARDISKGPGESSSSSETSPASATRKPYMSRKSKNKPVALGKRHVRSSSGYSSHNDETTFSISHAPSFNDRIHPPSRFSDLTLSDIECDKGHKSPRNTAALSKLTREAFQINV